MYTQRSRIEKKEKDESSQEEQAVEQPEQKKKSVKKKERKAAQTDQTSLDQKKNIGKADKNSTKPLPRPKYMGHKAVAPKLRKSAPCKTKNRPIVLPPPITQSTLNSTQNKTTKPKMPYDEWKRLKLQQQQQQRTLKQESGSNAKGNAELKEVKQDAPKSRRSPSPRGQQYFSLWRTAFIDALDKLKENKIRSIVLTTPDIVEADRERKSNDAKKRAWRPRQFDTSRSVEDIRSERSGSPEVIKFRGSYTKRHRARLALETSMRQQLEQVQRVVAANLARASQSTGDQQLSERRSEIITRSGLKRIRKVRA
ncbi:hypothetical protein MAR_000938 [Mya arenaria]|uniref:Uncharacterized protein n=1 Tax=Mya arenaria TaxID=6604 RepID=A0ABY7FAA3_MYAAR|nr:hypothetical protein MAR_000938 [Mya arenaria]